MKTSSILSFASLICFSLFLGSCTKENNGDPDGRFPKNRFAGQILHQYASTVMKIDAATGNESTFFSYSAYSNYGWDISRDGTIRIMAEREPGVYDRTRIMLVNVADQTIMKEFDFVPQYGNGTNNMGTLSFDNSMILMNADRENGFTILNTDGEVLHRLDGINDQALTSDDRAIWLPDNSILICFDDRFLLRSAPPYTSLSLVKEMNYENWGNVRVSNDGNKLSMYINKHIYLMDIDGENLVQVTESDGDENFAEFSPDDKYLLVGSDYFHGPTSMTSHWYLKIIPADSKKYNLDSDPAVVPVIPNGSSSIVKANQVTRWRP